MPNPLAPKMDILTLLEEAADRCQSPGVKQDVHWAMASLQRIAVRALAIDDCQILHELEFLGLVEEPADTDHV